MTTPDIFDHAAENSARSIGKPAFQYLSFTVSHWHVRIWLNHHVVSEVFCSVFGPLRLFITLWRFSHTHLCAHRSSLFMIRSLMRLLDGLAR
jgi:hypothetical protein